MFSPSPYNPDSQPLGHFKGRPVYLATVLVAVHVLSMLIGVFDFRGWAQALVFAPDTFSPFWQVWRWVTYVFVQKVEIWFLVEMYLLYRFAHDIELNFGRRTLAWLYAGLVLVAPLLATLVYLLDGGQVDVLAGSNTSTFCLFIAICLMEPDAPLFGISWLPLKLVGSLMVAMAALGHLASRAALPFGILAASCLLTYLILRRAGLPNRFEAIKEAWRHALPASRRKLPAVPGRRAGGSAPAAKAYYEPKIKPKADLAPERKAVEEVDAILDKIARSGMDSLTAAEKAALQNASTRLKDTDV